MINGKNNKNKDLIINKLLKKFANFSIKLDPFFSSSLLDCSFLFSSSFEKKTIGIVYN